MSKTPQDNFAEVLQALKQLPTGQGIQLTQRDFQETILRELGGLGSAQLEKMGEKQIKRLYIELLKEMGVVFEHVEETHVFPTSEDVFRYPLFPTQSRHIRFDTDYEQEIVDLLERTHSILLKVGFLSSYARVYVTDNLRKLCLELGFPVLDIHWSDHPAIATCFPRSKRGKFPLPILMLEYTPMPLPLYPCILHEILHLLVYYAWDLQSVFKSSHGVDLVKLIAASLLAETVVHSLATTVLGSEYLFSAIFIAIFQNSGRFAWDLSEEPPIKERLQAEVDPAQTFLATFPWISAAERAATLEPPSLFSRIRGMWSDEQKKCAKLLQPITDTVYETARLDPTSLEKATKLLGPTGPCGGVFLLHGLNLLFRIKWRSQIIARVSGIVMGSSD